MAIRLVLLCAVLTGAGCGHTEAAGMEAGIYPLVLDRVRAELQLDSTPIAVHPLMATVNRNHPELTSPLLGFNIHDPDVIPGILAEHPHHRPCTLSTALICQVAEGDVAVVLSEIIDLEVDGLGLFAVVHDRRMPGPLRYYAIRVKRSWGSWHIVQFSRMEVAD